MPLQISSKSRVYKIGVYIRYFSQIWHENYLEKHIQQYMDDIALCPQWTLVDFYVDRGMTAPHMEYSKEWCRLLEDCFTGKVNGWTASRSNYIMTGGIADVTADTVPDNQLLLHVFGLHAADAGRVGGV